MYNVYEVLSRSDLCQIVFKGSFDNLDSAKRFREVNARDEDDFRIYEIPDGVSNPSRILLKEFV